MNWTVLKAAGLAAILKLALTSPAAADVPNVVADIAPVQSLVAQVMKGVGTPDLLIVGAESPHAPAMRPSTARTVQSADIVFWVGPALSPWLEGPIRTLGRKARSVELLSQPETRVLLIREGMTFAEDEAHGHEDHDHGESAIDPHAWLDPSNAKSWLSLIARRLAEIDPDNAGVYTRNAKDGAARIDGIEQQIRQTLGAAGKGKFIVLHDAFQYYERAFGLSARAAIYQSEAVSPGPNRVQAIKQLVQSQTVTCMIIEPQFDPKFLSAVDEDDHLAIAKVDPLGSDLPLGPDLYPELLLRMSRDIAACLQ